jgi:restriction endonuclease Mrr
MSKLNRWIVILVLITGFAFWSQSSILLFLVIVFDLLSLKSILTEASFVAELDSVIAENMESLKRNHSILVQRDLNGQPMLAKWHAYVNQFITNNVQPALSEANRQRLKKKYRTLAVRRTNERTVEALRLSSANVPFTSELSPTEYEGFCANELRMAGWAVRLTPVVGDQGVDLIAEKEGVRVAIQCKRYSRSVGNKAVQEIAAGRMHHNASYGAVVSNSRFTEAAKALASSNGISLLHHKDLSRLEDFLLRRTGGPVFSRNTWGNQL